MIKGKWLVPFLPMIPYGVSAALATKYGFPDLTTRIIYTIGTLLVVAVLFAIVQPWKPDEPKTC